MARTSLVVGVLCSVLTVGCGDDPPAPTAPTPTTPVTPAAPTAVSLTIDGPDSLDAGQTAQYQAIVELSNNTTRPAEEPEWQSGNTTVAMVDDSGVVSARQAGTFDLSVSAEGMSSRKTGIAVLEPVGAWQTDISTDPIDDSESYVVWLDASTGRYSSIYDNYRLYAWCENGRTDVVIVWDKYIGSISISRHRVQYRFPPAAAKTENWPVSADGDASFSPRPVQFLREVVRNDTLVAKVWDFRGADLPTGTWDLFGALGALRPLAERCGFSL